MRRVPIAHVLVTAIVCIFCVGCGRLSEDEQRALRAAQYPRGRTEDQLIADAGEPTLKRKIGDSPIEVCSVDDAWALEYRFPRGGVWRALLRALSIDEPSMVIVVCLDDEGRVVSTHQLDF
jgi:hypothetical protein